MPKEKACAGFTKVELLVIVVVVVILAGMLLPPRGGTRVKAGRIVCVNNLKNLGLSFRIFATDHADQFPPAVLLTNALEITKIDLLSVYLSLTNELSTPKVIYCPEDKKRKQAESFTTLSTKNISYFVNLTASELSPQMFLAGDRNLQTNGVTLNPGIVSISTNLSLSWSSDLHQNQGNILMADGSVQQFSSSRLNQGLKDQEIATNYFALP
ncbi:MAG TPA: type II secretion system protein [Verrucomicrobiae bacterium]|nr:type II secretion system protein [Verrucomicrobiae bacterium]